jgi:hypothetical protein
MATVKKDKNSKSGNKDETPAEYLKQPEIGGIISKAMAVTFHAQPKNPIDFFARWLLSQSEISKRELQLTEDAIKLTALKDKYED